MNNDINPGRGSTAEQRAMGTEGRRQQVAAAKAFAAEHFIRDIPNGEALKAKVRESGLHLPAWFIPWTDTRCLKRAARRLGWPINQRRKALGCTSFHQYAERHQGWPAWAVLGQALADYYAHQNTSPQVLQESQASPSHNYRGYRDAARQIRSL